MSTHPWQNETRSISQSINEHVFAHVRWLSYACLQGVNRIKKNNLRGPWEFQWNVQWCNKMFEKKKKTGKLGIKFWTDAAWCHSKNLIMLKLLVWRFVCDHGGAAEWRSKLWAVCALVQIQGGAFKESFLVQRECHSQCSKTRRGLQARGSRGMIQATNPECN